MNGRAIFASAADACGRRCRWTRKKQPDEARPGEDVLRTEHFDER